MASGERFLRAVIRGEQAGADDGGELLGDVDELGDRLAVGDGFGDVLWYHSASRRGTLWVMDGDIGKDRSFGLPPLRWGWAMEASGDFDGDGLANDILLRHAATGMLEVWRRRRHTP